MKTQKTEKTNAMRMLDAAGISCRVVEETAMLFDEIAVSAGTRGAQIVINPDVLRQFIAGTYGNFVQ